MFSFLQKINPKKRDQSGLSTSSRNNGDVISTSSSKRASSEHINNLNGSTNGNNTADILPSSIDFSPDILQNFPSTAVVNGKKNKNKLNHLNTSQSSTTSFGHESTTTTNGKSNNSSDQTDTSSTTSKDQSTSHHHHKLINPFGRNNLFSRKSNMSLSSLSSGYFTTGRFSEKKHKNSASLGKIV